MVAVKVVILSNLMSQIQQQMMITKPMLKVKVKVVVMMMRVKIKKKNEKKHL
jgi:hypothetical protein